MKDGKEMRYEVTKTRGGIKKNIDIDRLHEVVRRFGICKERGVGKTFSQMVELAQRSDFRSDEHIYIVPTRAYIEHVLNVLFEACGYLEIPIERTTKDGVVINKRMPVRFITMLAFERMSIGMRDEDNILSDFECWDDIYCTESFERCYELFRSKSP